MIYIQLKPVKPPTSWWKQLCYQ